jgi:hypothetical protein
VAKIKILSNMICTSCSRGMVHGIVVSRHKMKAKHSTIFRTELKSILQFLIHTLTF